MLFMLSQKKKQKTFRAGGRTVAEMFWLRDGFPILEMPVFLTCNREEGFWLCIHHFSLREEDEGPVPDEAVILIPIAEAKRRQ